MPKMVYHEYMPSSDSMAAQIVDIKSAVKQKYIRVTGLDSPKYPYKVLQPENNCGDLKSLLGLYTNDALKDIVDALKADTPKNVRKELLIPLLSNEIIKNFEMLLKIMDDSLYHLLLKFKNIQKLPLNGLNIKSSFVSYLLQRGYLFRCLSQDEEFLLIPDELLHILDRLDEAEAGKIVGRNTVICKIGRGILYYYGVVDEYKFSMCLHIMFDSFVKGRPDIKIAFSKLNYSDYYRAKDLYQNVDIIFENYSRYALEVNDFYFNDNYHRRYFAYYSVFDPCNIYYEQQGREDLDFYPLSCNELMAGHLPDTKAKNAMRDYLTGHLTLDSIKANLLIEEWTCYVKNGENPNTYMNRILGYMDFKSPDQINEMFSFSSMYFMNELNQWKIKGHTPNELNGIRIEEQRREAAYKESDAECKGIWDKTGRNDPCPCGS
ncbi:MAG: hypothetical protein UV57_C0030G0006 [Parcubacteria group bacterium GW2011_GWD2_43_10]|nr:MAG: hypothetical protein UV57_C0030G0006 [Parcubacteria group bacterium GW2011_GWD2_43_10]